MYEAGGARFAHPGQRLALGIRLGRHKTWKGIPRTYNKYKHTDGPQTPAGGWVRILAQLQRGVVVVLPPVSGVKGEGNLI